MKRFDFPTTEAKRRRGAGVDGARRLAKGIEGLWSLDACHLRNLLTYI